MSPRSTIGPDTQLCGIALHPAGHTRSPAMHNAAFAALGIDAVYLAFDVPPEDLSAAISGVRALGMRQLAISIPHKERVIELLDDVDETARRIGAVNTVTRRGAKLVGSNTDWLGAVRAIEDVTAVADARAVVLGAGGAARAVVYGLRARGADVTVLNRNRDRARQLCADLEVEASGPISALENTPHDILVNTTSVGLDGDESPVDPSWICPTAVVMDAVYQPPETRLLRDAAARGARTIPGKWMLVHQAAEQLRDWTGLDAPVEVMAEAFDRAG
ncbi:MAG: shikimate dehydrogenase [Deltaproteobacteria bacterium]|jgi:shikimate dehydrogenase|nr:shikimate dehydrogenase [Deltaproteobacteria bacterium]MBW2542025.1 shikimate dehydrogenase [Deltaproteobacteria bacterium]